MKTHIVGLVVLAVVALAILVYVEQTGAHNARLQMAGLVADNTQSNLVGPEPDVDTASDLAAADYPIDVANSIPVPASTSPELRRGVANEIVLPCVVVVHQLNSVRSWLCAEVVIPRQHCATPTRLSEVSSPTQ